MNSSFMSIAEMRSQIGGLTESLEMLDRQTYRTVSTLQQALSLTRRMNLPENYVMAIDTVNRMIITVNALTAAYYAVLAARMAAGDPLAWIGAGIAVGGAAISVGTAVQSVEVDRRKKEW